MEESVIWILQPTDSHQATPELSNLNHEATKSTKKFLHEVFVSFVSSW